MAHPAFDRFKGPYCEAGAWLWLLCNCPVTTSYRSLAKTWGWSLGNVQRYLDQMRNDTWIDTRSDKLGTTISLGKSASYPASIGITDALCDTPSDTPFFTDGSDLFPDSLKPKKLPAKGSRLPQDWRLSKVLGEWAMKEGLSEDEVRAEAVKFRDYWLQSASKAAVKRDWNAAWRTWIRNSKKYQQGEGDGRLDEMLAKYGRS